MKMKSTIYTVLIDDDLTDEDSLSPKVMIM